MLLLHGWQNHRPAGHWRHKLADDLTADGVDVTYPALPDPDDPDRAAWSDRIAAEFDALAGRQRTVVAHSLAVWVVLDLLARGGLGRPTGYCWWHRSPGRCWPPTHRSLDSIRDWTTRH